MQSALLSYFSPRRTQTHNAPSISPNIPDPQEVARNLAKIILAAVDLGNLSLSYAIFRNASKSTSPLAVQTLVCLSWFLLCVLVLVYLKLYDVDPTGTVPIPHNSNHHMRHWLKFCSALHIAITVIYLVLGYLSDVADVGAK